MCSRIALQRHPLALGTGHALRMICSVALIAASAPVWAGCDNTAPTTGQTVTCTPGAPNPQTTPIVSVVGSSTLTLNVQAGAQLAVTAPAAVAFDGGSGHQIINNGSITNTSGIAVVSNGATSVINRGTIGGSVITGAGADRLEMLAGSITGGVLQGFGSDAVVFRDGTVDRIDQGDDQDSFEMSGGTITGELNQSRESDAFLMTGGTIGSVVQGDGSDTFRMTAGHIIGGFDDGDYAEFTGGRIGRVNMRLEDNSFLMSGGSIDGNLVTGFGNDTIVLSAGDIGGNISVSGGNDSLTVTGGTVGGNVLMSGGNDTFDWSGGGVLRGAVDFGEGDDRARLTNLGPDQLGSFTAFQAALGNDRLDLSNVKLAGVERLLNWEQVNLASGSELTMDGTLTLGDAATGTGALNVGAGSALLAGGGSGRVAALGAGQRATVTNAGRIDLSSGGSAPGDRFTIVGNYVGSGGTLQLQTVLGNDASTSDALVIDGGAASGNTVMNILNVGGSGASTVANGIMVVQAVNGATTAAGAFALSSGISVGAYEYFLFKGGVSAGTTENWYLRSTIVPGPVPAPAPAPVVQAGEPAPPPAPSPLLVPPTPEARRPTNMDVIPIYRVETPPYAVVPPLLREASMASLGTFHERQGEQRLLRGEGGFRAAWARLIGQSHEQNWKGNAQPGFDGHFVGVQAGADLYAHAGNTRDQLGVFVGRNRAKGDVTGFALGWENVAAGQTRLDDEHVGLYWTRVGAKNGYLDAVVMQSRYDGSSTSLRGLGVDLDGKGTTASLEVGKPLLRFGQSAWWLEPQLQVIWQRTDIDDTSDVVSAVRMQNDNAWTGRAGFRLAADYTLADNGWQPYLKVNYWRGFSGEDRIDIGGDPLTSEQAYRALEVGVGVVARFNANVSAFAVADYTRDLENDAQKERKVIEGNIGLRYDF